MPPDLSLSRAEGPGMVAATAAPIAVARAAYPCAHLSKDPATDAALAVNDATNRALASLGLHVEFFYMPLSEGTCQIRAEVSRI